MQSAAIGDFERPRLSVVQRWDDLGTDTRLAIRQFLDEAQTADPFQDPTFCGDGALGGGLAEYWMEVRQNQRILLVGYALENFALGRHFPRVRSLIFPKGPVANDVTDMTIGLRAIEDWARRHGMVQVDVQPQWTDDTIPQMSAAAETLGWINLEQPVGPTTLKVDLTKAPDVLLAAFDKGTRYEVRRAEKIGINVRKAVSKDDLATYYECYRLTSERKGFAALDRDVFLRLINRAAQEPLRGALFLAEKGSDLLGGIVVLRAGQCLHYVYGASTDRPDLRKLPIGYLLQWRAMEWAQEIGLRTYDLGGYTTATDRSTARFKKGFGGVPVKIAPLHRRILRPLLYRSAVGLKKLKSFRTTATMK